MSAVLTELYLCHAFLLSTPDGSAATKLIGVYW